MNKISTVFLRDYNDTSVMTREVNPLCQWVLDGEGVPTRKYDGTCVMMDDDGKWWARREVKPGKTPPPNWMLVETDDVTGKAVGWEPIEQSSWIKFFNEALERVQLECDARGWTINPGTYELCGPKINGNPEGYPYHYLVSHAEAERFDKIPADMLNSYDAIKATILGLEAGYGWEGIVWHHPDGRMAKMKARDYNKEVTT